MLPKSAQNMSYESLDRQRSRLNSLSSVFAKTNRILSGNREITVAIKPLDHTLRIPEGTPAYSNGKDIVINIDRIGNLNSQETLMQLQGLNLHEFCHILYTPRMNTSFRKWVAQNSFGMIMNILEDQRIETLFLASYRPARHYFISMVLGYIMNDPQTWDHAHLLVHGRRYIPLAIREEFAKRWYEPNTTARIAGIIDNYRTLDLTKFADDQTARNLIEEMYKLLQSMPQSSRNKLEENEGCQQGECKEGKPDTSASSSASEKAKKDTEEQDKKEDKGEDGSDFWEDSDEAENDEEGSDDGEEDSDGGEDEKMDGEGESESDGDDDDAGSDAGEGDEESSGGSGDDDSEGNEGEKDDGDASGQGSGDGEGDDENESSVEESGHGSKGSGMTSTELSDELEDVLNAIADNEQIKEDVRQLNAAINDLHNFDLDAPKSGTMLIDVPAHVQQAGRKVSDAFRRLYAEMEPGWKYGSDEGKLNVGRAIMNDHDPDTIFDEWDEGRQESAGLEVLIALDVSGSMGDYYDLRSGRKPNGVSGTPIEAACLAVWIMKKSCEELGATVSVVGFGNDASTIIPRHDKAQLNKAVFVKELEGSTNPAEAFAIARWVLNESDQPNKLFVVVTDGVWGDGSWKHSRYVGDKLGTDRYKESNDNVTLLKQINATKVYLGIGQDLDRRKYAGVFDVSRVIKDAAEIVPVVKAAIEAMLRSK